MKYHKNVTSPKIHCTHILRDKSKKNTDRNNPFNFALPLDSIIFNIDS